MWLFQKNEDMFHGSFFHLKEYNTNIPTEILAGITTFLAMAYILAVNPSVLSNSGMPVGAVYLATIIATVVGCLLLGLFANVPLAQSASLGLNTFFAVTVVQTLGFTWQQALSMVFICGILNMVLTMTRIRAQLITAIPDVLKIAIGCGIGLFIAYIGFLNAGFITISGSTPAINWAGLSSDPALWLFIIGLFISIALFVKKVKGAFFISIVATTLIGLIPCFGVTSFAASVDVVEAFTQLPETFGVIFTAEGLPSLFSDLTLLPIIIVTIITFSLVDMFDTIGTLIGAGREIHLFDNDQMKKMLTVGKFHTRAERAMIADASATVVGAIAGTSNIGTYVESSAGIEVGGRTGLTAVVVALCFLLCIPFAALATAVPAAATAPILVMIGVLMLKPIKDIDWSQYIIAIPCFFTTILMTLCYSITDGIAMGFITYCFVMIVMGKAKKVHLITWCIAIIFILYSVMRVLIF